MELRGVRDVLGDLVFGAVAKHDDVTHGDAAEARITRFRSLQLSKVTSGKNATNAKVIIAGEVRQKSFCLGNSATQLHRLSRAQNSQY